MADLTTTVHSPLGPITSILGRVPKQKATNEVRELLRRKIREAQAHLDEFDNWTTTCERGSTRARTYEEM